MTNQIPGTRPMPKNIGLVIEPLAPPTPMMYDNIQAVQELQSRAQKLFAAGEHDRGTILAYALKYQTAATREIEDVIGEYTFETEDKKTQTQHNREQLVSEFIKVLNEDMGAANYAKWLTYYLNINSINEIVCAGAHSWRIVAWTEKGDILSKEYYDLEIQPLKQWLIES